MPDLSPQDAALYENGKDAAQQIITAFLHGDRSTAIDIAIEYPSPLVLALTTADLAAYVHHRWSLMTGADRDEGWAELMADIEEWRASQRGETGT